MWGSGAQAPGSLHMGFAPVSGGTELLASFLFLKALPSPSVEPKWLRIAGHYTGEERELFSHKCYLHIWQGGFAAPHSAAVTMGAV